MPTWAWSVVCASLIGLTGWVVRALVTERLDRHEKSIAALGKRLGDCEAWQKAHDAVERDRRRRGTRELPRGGDGGE